MENWFILKVFQVGASLVFHIWPLLSNMCIPFTFSCEGNLKQKALLTEIRAMVAKGAMIPLYQDPGSGFYCNLFLMMKVTEGY